MSFFGTDGIRGEFGTFLTTELISKIGKSAGVVFKKNEIKNIIIGMDPRISSQNILDILCTELQIYGVNIDVLGVVSTPVVSYGIVNNENIDAGIMISASHNPFQDNGIKFFGKNGQKISSEIEKEIEKELELNNFTVENSTGTKKTNEKIVKDYVNFLINQGSNLKGKKIGLDCANGSAYLLAGKIFQDLGATVEMIGTTPDGYNINENIGSTHPEKMQKIVTEKKLDFAFCYDGDADRVQLIDQEGELLDGDYILYLLAKELKQENKLKNNQVVSTVMSNLGYKKAINKLGLVNLITAVGDKYVMKEMAERGSSLGGEQSGHIILSDYISTGDGILTSVILSNIINKEDFSFSNLKQEMVKFPQILSNYKCQDKKKIMENEELKEFIKQIEKKMGDDGRILVRASGTENLIRIMVESPKKEDCQEIINKIMEKIEKI